MPIANRSDFDRRLLAWLTGNDTGRSSETLVRYLVDGVLSPTADHVFPRDPDDLGRCLRALETLPEIRPHLSEAVAISPVWKALVEHWDELEALYREEAPTRRAPRCYARMRELIEPVDCYAVGAHRNAPLQPLGGRASRSSSSEAHSSS